MKTVQSVDLMKQASRELWGSAGLKMPFTPTFPLAILACKLGQTDLDFGVRSGSLVGLCLQDYKSLCAAVTICATLVDIRTHRQHFDQLMWIAQPAVGFSSPVFQWAQAAPALYRNRNPWMKEYLLAKQWSNGMVWHTWMAGWPSRLYCQQSMYTVSCLMEMRWMYIRTGETLRASSFSAMTFCTQRKNLLSNWTINSNF